MQRLDYLKRAVDVKRVVKLKPILKVLLICINLCLVSGAVIGPGMQNATEATENATSIKKSFESTSIQSLSSPSSYSVVFAAVAKNLTVESIPSLIRNQAIQLNISWTQPEGTTVDDYTLEVMPQSKSSDCTTKLCYEYNIDRTATSWLVPSSTTTVDGDSCTIGAGCFYNVTLISHPWNGSSRATATIKVPECVGNVCSCAYADMLPTPLVKVSLLPEDYVPPGVTDDEERSLTSSVPSVISPEIKMTYVNITWTIPSSPAPRRLPKMLKIKNIVVSLGSLKVQTNYRKPWYGHDIVWHVSSSSLWFVAKVNITVNQTHLARVYILDNRDCIGPAGNDTFSLTKEMSEEDYTFWILLRPELWVLSCALIAALSVLALRHWGCAAAKETLAKCFRRPRPYIPHAQPGWLHSIDRNAEGPIGTTGRIEEISPLYVEKEIEELGDPWEINPRLIRIGREIGRGAFGRVYKAKVLALRGAVGQVTAAMKMLDANATADETSEFLAEIEMLKKADCHRHVVRLLGCCTQRPPLAALMEFAPRGDLLRLLKAARARWISFNMTNSPTKGEFLHLVHSASSLSSAYFYSPSCDEKPEDPPPLRPSITETEYTVLESEGYPTGTLNKGTSQHYVSGPGEKERAVSAGSAARTGSDPFCSSSLDEDYSYSLKARVFTPVAPLDPAELHSFALQIARGMEHLEKKDITHRDVAARNVLVDADGVLKISDFGLSRTGLYVNTRHRKVPLRWLALEALRENCYSSKSDVWAYGIVLWEIGTLGGFPYPSLSNDEVLSFLSSGRRMEKPDSIKPELYELMTECWRDCPDYRPSFQTIVSRLEMAGNTTYVNFDSLKGYVFPPTEVEAQDSTL